MDEIDELQEQMHQFELEIHPAVEKVEKEEKEQAEAREAEDISFSYRCIIQLIL